MSIRTDDIPCDSEMKLGTKWIEINCENPQHIIFVSLFLQLACVAIIVLFTFLSSLLVKWVCWSFLYQTCIYVQPFPKSWLRCLNWLLKLDFHAGNTYVSRSFLNSISHAQQHFSFLVWNSILFAWPSAYWSLANKIVIFLHFKVFKKIISWRYISLCHDTASLQRT